MEGNLPLIFDYWNVVWMPQLILGAIGKGVVWQVEIIRSLVYYSYSFLVKSKIKIYTSTSLKGGNWYALLKEVNSYFYDIFVELYKHMDTKCVSSGDRKWKLNKLKAKYQDEYHALL